MSLFDRLSGNGQSSQRGIGPTRLLCALREYVRGEATRNQIVNFFNIAPADEAAFDALLARIDAKSNALQKLAACDAVFDVCAIAQLQGGTFYTQAEFNARVLRV